MQLGLRIDVDTYKGARYGVPAILRVLSRHGIQAAFFFSVGPDNMGRHVLSLVKPEFLKKMIRSRAPSLYGWDIVFNGTVLPGPVIGKTCDVHIRSAFMDGHETGLHAWDHYLWQTGILKMNDASIFKQILKGVDALTEITGSPPVASASPGWVCNWNVLAQKNKFPFKYNSDTRGRHPFFPKQGLSVLSQPQIPVTLPTYDEAIGRGKISRDNYNDHILSLISSRSFNTLTIHAEVEGMGCLDLFEDFLRKAFEKGIKIVPLGHLLDTTRKVHSCGITQGSVDGRHSIVAVQEITKQRVIK